MGRLWAAIEEVSRLLALEEVLDSPRRFEVLAAAPYLRSRLRWLHTQYYALEACLPTPETLSAAAYGRALSLGLSVEAAEAERSKAWHHAKQAARLRAAA
jgi:hypothetical protein